MSDGHAGDLGVERRDSVDEPEEISVYLHEGERGKVETVDGRYLIDV